jgi:hypothetical protein
MMPVAMQPGLVTADGSGFGEVRYPNAPPAMARRRRVIILLATAVAAVLLGIVAMLVFRATRGRSAPAPTEPAPAPSKSPGPGPAASGTAPAAPDRAAAPAPAGAAPAGGAPAPAGASAATAPAPAGSPAAPAATPPAAAAAPPAAPAADCFADVSSQPAGAEIVVDQDHVLGTTPSRVALPCGNPVELVIRKQCLVAATRTVTPTPEGARVQVALPRQMFVVKVSSTPTGATVMLGGKSLGVTPTTVKVPAFEASTLVLSKDGYDNEPEKVAPRGNGTSVHTVLKKSAGRRPAR